MRLPREKYIPILSERVQDILTVYSKSRTEAVFLVQRSKIVLMASQGMASKDISEKVGKHYNTVALWRKRFIEAGSVLAFVEAELPEQLEELVIAILSDEYRSGVPKTYGDDVRSRDHPSAA